MSVRVEITGEKSLYQKLTDTIRKWVGGKPRPSIIVGYTTHYAIYVHENLACNHPNGGQAKYLEEPFRAHKAYMMQIVKAEMKAGHTLEQSLLIAGFYLQRESQKLVPVDTGRLKGSAFTALKGSEPAQGLDPHGNQGPNLNIR